MFQEGKGAANGCKKKQVSGYFREISSIGEKAKKKRKRKIDDRAKQQVGYYS